MQGPSLGAMPPSMHAAIAVAIVLFAVAVAVLRRVRGGEAAGAAGRFSRHRAPRPATAVIAALVAVGVGLSTLMTDRRGASRTPVLRDSLSGAADATASGTRMAVFVAIGAVALVALVVALLKMRDGER